jgi:hypothetical protein
LPLSTPRKIDDAWLDDHLHSFMASLIVAVKLAFEQQSGIYWHTNVFGLGMWRNWQTRWT